MCVFLGVCVYGVLHGTIHTDLHDTVPALVTLTLQKSGGQLYRLFTILQTVCGVVCGGFQHKDVCQGTLSSGFELKTKCFEHSVVEKW